MGEDGRISKQNLVVLGTFVGATALASALAAQGVQAQHTNNINLDYAQGTATASHSSHSSHSSY